MLHRLDSRDENLSSKAKFLGTGNLDGIEASVEGEGGKSIQELDLVPALADGEESALKEDFHSSRDGVVVFDRMGGGGYLDARGILHNVRRPSSKGKRVVSIVSCANIAECYRSYS